MSDDRPVASYPPEHHVLRDLPLQVVAVDPDRSQALLELTPQVLQGGSVSAGALMTVIDVLGGGLCGRVVAPDWMATSALAIHLGDAPSEGVVVAEAAVVRNGRNSVVIEVGLTTQSAPDEPFGECVLSFMRLPRRDSTMDLSSFEVRYGEPMTFSLAGSGLVRPFDDAIGVELGDPAAGATTTAITPYIRNSFGAVNGGVVAALAEAAARSTAGSILGGPCRTVDAEVHYMVQGKVGPLITRTVPLRRRGDLVVMRSEVLDQGNPGPDGDPTRMVLAHVGVEHVIVEHGRS